MELNNKPNYEALQYKYFPFNIDSDKKRVLALKFSITYTEIVEIDINTGIEILYRLKESINDCNPVGIYDYEDYFIIICHSLDNAMRLYKYDKKKNKQDIYNFFKGKVKRVYSEKGNNNLYISILKEKAELYILNIENLILDVVNENEEYYITYLKEIEENLILTQGILLKNWHNISRIYDDKWRQLESINYNINSDDLCYAHDLKRNINLVISNVLGENKLFLQRNKEISDIDIFDNTDILSIQDYIYDKGILIYQVEKAMTCILSSYDVDTGQTQEILSDQISYMVKNIDNTLVIVGNSVNAQLVISIYDLSQNKIIDKYFYPRNETVTGIPEKKYIEVNERRVDYIEYPPYDYKNVKGYIIYLHGGPATHWFPKYNELFVELQKENFSIIYPNYFGSSQYGKIDYDKKDNKWGIKDVEDVICLRKCLNHKNVILIGESFGAYLAINVWNKTPNQWAGVITYASFYTPWSLYEVASETVKSTVERHIAENDIGCSEMKPYQNNEKIFTKIFLIHGKQDEKIPYEQSIKIFDYLNKNYEWDNKPVIKLIANATHSNTDVYRKFQVESYILRVVNETVR